LKKKKKKKKKGRKKVLWRGEKEEKEPKKQKKLREVLMMLLAECGEKKGKKNLVYLGFNYFGAIFYFLLRYWLRIGGYKMEGLHSS
jgi:DNA invertase Pin-like site-specific DNA recombinase